MVSQPPARPFPARIIRAAAIAGGVLAAIVVIAGAGIALVAQSEWLRDKLAAESSDRLGRNVAIAGPLDIAWSWRATRVRAQDLRIANAPGLEDPNMLEIAALDITFRPIKLLFGRLELPEIRLTSPKLVLERTADGAKNWDMPAFSGGNIAATTLVPEERGDFPIIGALHVEDAHVIYRDAIREINLDLKISSLSGDGGAKKDSFKLDGAGSVGGKPFTLAATGGSVFSLRDSGRDFPLKADIRMGDTSAFMEGAFTDPLRMRGVDTAIHIKGPNLADLFHLTGIPLPPTPAYDLGGRLKRTGNVWAFEIPDGKIGDSDIKASGTYDTGGERGFLKATLESQTMHLDDLGGFIGLKPAGNETVAPRARFFPDVPINLARLRTSDLNVHLVARKLVAKGWPFSSLDVVFDLERGLLNIAPVEAGIAGGTMTGSIVLDGRKDVPRVETDIALRRLSMKEFFGGTRFEDLSSGRFGGRFHVAGDGRSLAEVLGTADGRISVMMAGGQVSLLLIEAAGLDVAEFTMRLLGEDKTTRVRCGIGDFAVKNGRLASDIFVFDTADTNIEGQAEIDLKAETIDAQVEAHPKDPSPLSARTPLRITGPLKKPGIGLNPQGLAARGAGAAALALLNPLAAIIPFIETGSGEDADCRGLIRDVRARYGGEIPGPTPAEAPLKAE